MDKRTLPYGAARPAPQTVKFPFRLARIFIGGETIDHEPLVAEKPAEMMKLALPTVLLPLISMIGVPAKPGYVVS